MPKDESFLDSFVKGFANAVADVREKVVEEPWYGRVINDRDSGAQWPQAREAEPAASREQAEPNREREKAAEKDIDIDR